MNLMTAISLTFQVKKKRCLSKREKREREEKNENNKFHTENCITP